MPLFMAISGWLFYYTRLADGKWSYIATLRDKSVRLLIPFVFFTLLAFAMKIAFPSEMSRGAGLSFKEVAGAFINPYDGPLREMWFIMTLFWLFLLMPVWKLTVRNAYIKWLTLALLVVLHFIHPAVSLFCIDRLCSYAVFFYLGLIVCMDTFVERAISGRALLFLFAGVAVYIAGYYSDPLIQAMGGILFSCSLALILDRIIPWCFHTFRDYTYQIFLMGIFAQILVKILFRHIRLPYIVAYLICVLAGLYVPVLVSIVLKKINWPPLLYCVGLRPKKQ